MVLRDRAQSVMARDSHVCHDEGYLIRSIYFDDPYNSCYYANEDGVTPREKWRIRSYDLNGDYLLLECKRKEHDMIRKSSCRISHDEFEKLLIGIPIITGESLIKRFSVLQQTYLMKPSVMVEYMRLPYVFPQGNVRLTFDYNISSSIEFPGFFSSDIYRRPALARGEQLVEVKFDEYIPDFLYHLIQLTNMRQITFSKYCICRRHYGFF